MHTQSRRLIVWVVVAAGACSAPGFLATPTPTAMALVNYDGNGITATDRTSLSFTPRLRLTDASGAYVGKSGVPVTVVLVGSGAALIGTTTTTTDGSGTAAFSGVTVGGIAGSYTLRFSSPGLASVDLPVDLRAGPAAMMIALAGNNQSAAPGTNVAIAPSVKVMDADSNGVPGVQVAWAVTSGAGHIQAPTNGTNSTGIATSFPWALGPAAGVNTLTASVTSLINSPITFTAIATATATKLIVVTAPSPLAQSGVAFPVQPAIRVTDANNANVALLGKLISVAITSGGGTLAGADTARTDSSGSAAFSGLSITGAAGIRALTFSSPGLVNTSASVTVVASTTPTYQLSLVTTGGTGSGSITASPSGLSYPAGTVVTLTATPSANSAFSGWGGACSGVGNCTVTIAGNTTVTATFTLIGQSAYTLSLSMNGTGTGSTTASPAGLNYAAGTSVTVTATAAAGSTFTGWAGACAGTGNCTVVMNSNKSVVATFTLITGPVYTLSLGVLGTGGGTVTASPSGPTYAAGTVVTVTAAPDSNSVFDGWFGACSGTQGCNVTMTANASVSASFSPRALTHTLRLTKAGDGSGTLATNPVTADIGEFMSPLFRFATGTTVVVTATPAQGSIFAGWSEACTGAASCTVVMDADKQVVGTFQKPIPAVALTLMVQGWGSGTVTASPPGPYLYGARVRIAASATNGSTFAKWVGSNRDACPDRTMTTCDVTLTSDLAVSGIFIKPPHPDDGVWSGQFSYSATISTNPAVRDSLGLSFNAAFTDVDAAAPGAPLIVFHRATGIHFTGAMSSYLGCGAADTCQRSSDGALYTSYPSSTFDLGLTLGSGPIFTASGNMFVSGRASGGSWSATGYECAMLSVVFYGGVYSPCKNASYSWWMDRQ